MDPSIMLSPLRTGRATDPVTPVVPPSRAGFSLDQGVTPGRLEPGIPDSRDGKQPWTSSDDTSVRCMPVDYAVWGTTSNFLEEGHGKTVSFLTSFVYTQHTLL